MTTRSILRRSALGAGAALLLLVTAVSSGQAALPSVVPQRHGPSDALLRHVSSGVAVRTWLADPANAPQAIQPQLEALARAQAVGAIRSSPPAAGSSVSGSDAFNEDFVGLPQNEDSLGVCQRDPDVVLGSTNDYRGLLNPRGNFTGWHYSADGGRSLLNEGLLPAVNIQGAQTPSGGDPVTVSVGRSCQLYAASLNYDPADAFGNPNGIGLYRTTPRRLASCRGGDAPACWPTRRAVATNAPGHFLDKEWMTVGRSGSAGRVVWVTYSDFDFTADNPAGFTAQIRAVRCTPNLASCTRPILISGGDEDVQFSDVTIGPDGRTYVTWSQIKGELEGTPQTFVHKLRVAPAGSTNFGPTRVVYSEDKAIPFGGKLNANDFRVATYPKNTVAEVGDQPRVFVTWDACSVRVLGETVCEGAVVKLTWSDDRGRTWHRPVPVSVRGQNYFPTIDYDRQRKQVAIAYFTSRYDLGFDNRQDVELVTRDAATPAHFGDRLRITSVSNEPEADPILGGRFIGDYIEVVAQRGNAYVHYNANYESIPLLGEGRPIPQQDNFIARTER